jgi:hypothetical protein
MVIMPPIHSDHLTDNPVPEIMSARSPLPPIDKWENV